MNIYLFICLNKHLRICAFVDLHKCTITQIHKLTNAHSIIPFVIYINNGMLVRLTEFFATYR